MGLVILVTIFVLPFNNDNTLYYWGTNFYSNLGSIQAAGDASYIAFAYIEVIAFILLVIAGCVGIFPLGTGVLGVVGMAMLTANPYMVYPAAQNTLVIDYGYYIIWAASVIALIASFWHGKKEQAAPAAAPAPVNVNVSQTMVGGSQGQAPPPSQGAMVKCPKCGTSVASGTAKCPNCGTNLM